MRVGFDVSCVVQQPLTGVGYATLHLVRALARHPQAPDIRLFASGGGRLSPALGELATVGQSLSTVRWPTRLKLPMWARLGWPPLERFTGPVDIAHGMFHLVPPSRKALRAVTVYDLAAVRFDDMHTRRVRDEHRGLLRHAARHADALVTTSASTRRDLVELLGTPPEKVHVVLCGVDLDAFAGPFPEDALAAARTKFGIEGPYLLYLGTLEPRKNLARLVEAYGLLRERVSDVPRLVLAGGKGWLYEDVFQAITRHRLENAVTHTGYIHRDEAIALMRGAEGFVYPSRYEGFGLPVLEAMAARIPVLTSNVSSLPEVIGDGGILVDPDSVEAIADGLRRLVTDREANSARVMRAHARASRMMWADSARSLLGLYQRLLGAHP